MKKRIVWVLILSICLSLLAACGTAGTTAVATTKATTATAGATAVAATTTAGGSAAAEFKFKFGHDQPVEHAYHLTAVEFARLVKEKTKGRVSIEVFPAAQLGTEVNMLESLALGTLDFQISSTSNASTYVPELGQLSVCYLFNNSDHLKKAATDPQINQAYKDYTKNKKTGFELMTLQAGGCRQLYTTAPVADLAALNGMKIRVMPSPVESQVWSALGAKPTTVAFGEVYTALQTKLVQGAENTLSSYYSAKHYEVAKYLNESFHQWSFVCLWASDKTMAKLPADLQASVREAANEAATYGFKAQLDNDAKFKELLKKEGVTFTTIDIKPWAEKIKPIQDEIATKYNTKAILDRIRSLA